MERWKDIPGFEGLYQASDTGLIRSAPGKVTANKRFGHRLWKTRILKFKHKSSRRDAAVTLWKDGECKDYLVSRLVAKTWVEGYADGLTVNHIDGNPQNNNINNLEWMSLGDNIRHGFGAGLYHSQSEVVLANREEKMRFRSMAEASRFLGRNVGYISDCHKKERKAKSIHGVSYWVFVSEEDGVTI